MEQLIPHRLDVANISEDLKPVLALWDSLKPANAIASAWRDFDLLDIPPKLLPATIVADIDPQTRAMKYRYFGSQISEVFGGDRTGVAIGEMPDFYAEASLTTYGWVIDEKEPVLHTLEYTRDHAKSRVMEIIRLPLSDNGADVSHVVSVASFILDRREFSRMMNGEA